MRPSISSLFLLVALTAAAAEAPPDQTQPAAGEPPAQESKPPDPGAKTPTPPAPSTAKPAPNSSADADESTDVFKPSETISEDAAIPYPADI
jgi:hypothetical protein